MADMNNVSDKELKDTKMVEKDNMAHIQMKRKLELEDIHIIRKIKTVDVQNGTEVQTSPYQSYPLDYLPDLVLEKIIGNLSFHEIAKARMVCTNFNDTCKRQLNRGFRLNQNIHKKYLEQSRQQLQRYEKNDTICFYDIMIKDTLLKIDGLYLLLNMTFLKYIEANCFCFIPGKVIDDISKVLFLSCQIKKFKSQSKENYFAKIFSKLLSERKKLENSSLMAIGHFLSEILPMNRITITPPRIFSSNTSFENSILRSFIGSLCFEDILQHKFIYLYSMEEQTEIYLNSLKEEFQTACFKENDRLHLLERDIEADKILGHVSLNNQSFYLVKWKGVNEADFFTYKDCSMKFPHIWWQYEEERTNVALINAKIDSPQEFEF